MRVTVFPSVAAQTIERHEVKWAQIVERCLVPAFYPAKAAMPLIKLAAFGDTASPKKGVMRWDGNVIGVSGVEIDYDGEQMPVYVAAALLEHAGIESVIYTSPSHRADAPRWRVLAPLSHECPPQVRREMVARLNGALGGVIATESFVLSQTYFIGRAAGVEYDATYVPGSYVDLLPLVPLYPSKVAPTYSGPVEDREVTAETIADLQSALPAISADDYSEWISVGQALAGLGETGREMWREWSATSDKYDPDVTDWKWTTFAPTRTGFASIFARAQRCGWVNPAARKPLDLGGIGFGTNIAPPMATAPDTPPPTGASAAYMPIATPIEGGRLATGADLLRVFAGCTYVQSLDAMLVPGGDLLNKSRFNARLGGYSFMIDPANTTKAKTPWECFTGSQCFDFPRAHDICFRPEIPPGCMVNEAGRVLANVWWPVETARIPGDVGPFLDLLGRILPHPCDRDIVLAYMAAIVQHPGRKFQWCPVIQGAKGNGKSFIGYALEEAVGHRYSHRPNSQDIGNKFTGWLRAKLLIVVEEISTHEKTELLETLKPLITNPRIELQGKGADQVTGDNRANFIMFVNPKGAMPVDKDERRYAIFHTAQQEAADIVRDGMSGEYFPRLYDWARAGGYAHIAHYLATYQIPDAINPAGACHRAPLTSSTAEAIEVSRGPIEQEILELIGQGAAGFCGGWVSSIMLDRALASRRVSRQRQSATLAALGYVLHPGLPGGRACHPVMVPDGGRPRLWIKPGHLSENGQGAAEISRMYQQAQGMGFGAGASVAAHG